jgi:hypothetical protein
MLNYINKFEKWYNGLHEPYRVIMTLIILHPIILLYFYHNIYNMIGTLLLLTYYVFSMFKTRI